jgi:hypothetical protein
MWPSATRFSMQNSASKIPSTNIQAPEKFQTPSSKSISHYLVWNLKIEVSLELGAWNLEFLLAAFSADEKE